MSLTPSILELLKIPLTEMTEEKILELFIFLEFPIPVGSTRKSLISFMEILCYGNPSQPKGKHQTQVKEIERLYKTLRICKKFTREIYQNICDFLYIHLMFYKHMGLLFDWSSLRIQDPKYQEQLSSFTRDNDPSYRTEQMLYEFYSFCYRRDDFDPTESDSKISYCRSIDESSHCVSSFFSQHPDCHTPCKYGCDNHLCNFCNDYMRMNLTRPIGIVNDNRFLLSDDLYHLLFNSICGFIKDGYQFDDGPLRHNESVIPSNFFVKLMSSIETLKCFMQQYKCGPNPMFDLVELTSISETNFSTYEYMLNEYQKNRKIFPSVGFCCCFQVEGSSENLRVHMKEKEKEQRHSSESAGAGACARARMRVVESVHSQYCSLK